MARQITGLDEVLEVVCETYRAHYTGYIHHAYLGGVYTAVRGTRVFRAFSASCLVSSLRDSYDPSIVSGEFAVMLPEDAPAEQATPIDW